jgi:hypothetical protein
VSKDAAFSDCPDVDEGGAVWSAALLRACANRCTRARCWASAISAHCSVIV